MHLEQDTLFSAPLKGASIKVIASIEALNKRYGRDALHIASAGHGQRWAMRAENPTPKYSKRRPSTVFT